MFKSGILVGCAERGSLHVLLGKLRLGNQAGKWGVPQVPVEGRDSVIDWLVVRQHFDKSIWPKFAPVKGRTADWTPFKTVTTGILRKTRWELVLLKEEPASLKLDFSDEEAQRLGAYTGNWPFGLADFKDLRWWPASALPNPLIPGVKTALKLWES